METITIEFPENARLFSNEHEWKEFVKDFNSSFYNNTIVDSMTYPDKYPAVGWISCYVYNVDRRDESKFTFVYPVK